MLQHGEKKVQEHTRLKSPSKDQGWLPGGRTATPKGKNEEKLCSGVGRRAFQGAGTVYENKSWCLGFF